MTSISGCRKTLFSRTYPFSLYDLASIISARPQVAAGPSSKGGLWQGDLVAQAPQECRKGLSIGSVIREIVIFHPYFPDPFEVARGRTVQNLVFRALAIDFQQIYTKARIFVRADQSTAYGNVVDVMSRLQQDGFVQVGIFAETASEG